MDSEPVAQLTSEEWLRIFSEADDLGISFILLVGGEPLLRRDIIEAAGKRRNILFPIFTNGTFMDDRYLALFASAPASMGYAALPKPASQMTFFHFFNYKTIKLCQKQ